MIDKPTEHGDVTPIEREAHGWVRRLTSGEASTADGAALRTWCAQSPAHAAAFSEASQFWQAFGPAGQALRDDEKTLSGSRRFAGRGVTTRRAVVAGALAASAAGVMIVRPPLGLWPSLSELRADYRTRTGEQRQIAVADGISVQMDSQTSMSIAPGGETVGVELIAGQASFSLAERGAKSFRVLAAGGRTIATLAHFDVRLTGTGACVTCLSHDVAVDYRGQRVPLQEGQQVVYDDTGLRAVAAIDPAVASSWQQGIIIFKMTPLADVIDELNRYRSGRIILLTSGLARSPVSGRFRIDQPNEVLTQIERAFSVRRRDLPGGVVLLS
jgi:transmembrane sensor